MPDPTMFLLSQVVLLHPVSCELVGGDGGKSRSMQGPHEEQENQSRYVHASQQHGVTSHPTGVKAPVCKQR